MTRWHEMKKAHMVLLCFSAFVVLAGGVLGYGLWRRGAGAAESRRRLTAADRILGTAPADSLARTRAEQTRQLVEARALRQALSAPQADPSGDRARQLGAWIAEHLDLRVAVDRKRRQLAKLREELACDALAGTGGPPAAIGGGSPCRQVSSATAQRLRAAAKRAEAAAGDLRVHVGGKQVDLSPAVGEEALRVQAEAQRVVAELGRREAAFEKYAAAMEQALAAKQLDDARRRGADLDKWLAMAAGAEKKRRRLAALASRLAGTDRNGEQEKTLLSRIDGLLGVLTGSTSAKETEVAVSQCDDVVKSAEAFVKLRPSSAVTTKLQALIAAKSAAPGRMRKLSAGARLGNNRQDTIDHRILPPTVALVDPTTAPADVADWQKAATPIRKAIQEVESVDPDGAFLAMLLDATKPHGGPTTAPMSSPVQWVGPPWAVLDANFRGLNELRKHCDEHGRGKKPYQPIPPQYSAFVTLQFAKVHDLVEKYMEQFEKFKKEHTARLREKQAVEAKKSGRKSRLPKDHGRKTIFDF